MNAGERWKLRWRSATRSWLRRHLERISPTRSRDLRFALDRSLQQIAQFPYSGAWCGSRYDDFVAVPEAYRVAMVGGVLLLFYRVIDDERMIVFVHAQTTAMNLPPSAIFLPEHP